MRFSFQVRILTIVVCTIFLVATVSAWEFDNVKIKDVDNPYKISIHNAFSLPLIGGEIATIELINYSGFCFPSDCWMYMKLSQKSNDIVSLKYTNTYFMTGQLKEKGTQYQMWDATPYEESVEREVCEKAISNVSGKCSKQLVKEYRIGRWVEYDPTTKLKEGIYLLRAKVDVSEGETVDIVPNFYGLDLTEWVDFTGLTKYEYYETGADQGCWISNDPSDQCAQTFKVGTTGTDENFEVQGVSVLVNDPYAVGHGDIGIWIYGVDGSGLCDFDNLEAYKNYTTTNVVSNEWLNMTLDFNSTLLASTSYCVQVNSTDIPSGSGGLIWKYDASAASYNGGNLSIGDLSTLQSGKDALFQIWGTTGSNPIDLTITLNSPTLAYETTKTSITFNVTNVLLAGVELHNTTLYIWNNTGIFNTNSTSINGTVNESNLILDGLTTTNYSWGYHTCALNETSFGCEWSNNRTFTVNALTEISEVWVNQTTEGNTERFELNVSLPAGVLISYTNLNYNNTNYAGAVSAIAGTNYSIARSIEVPNVNANSNLTFYWVVNLNNSEQYNSTWHNQSVLQFTVDNCTTNSVVILNYTIKDEGTNTILDSPPSLNTTEPSIETEVTLKSVASGATVTNTSVSMINSSELLICVPTSSLDNATYRLDATTTFTSTSRVTEFHFLQNHTLNESTPLNISLMDLLSADSTSFLMTYTDTSNIPISNVIVITYRKYVGDGVFREVERSKTDENGQTVIHLLEEDAIYYFEFWKEGSLLHTTSESIQTCQTTPCELSFQQGAGFVDFDDEDYDMLPGGTYSFSSNKSARTVTLTYNFGSTSHLANLTLFQAAANQSQADTAINSSAENATSGTIDLYIPISYGNRTFYIVFYVNDEFIANSWVDLHENPNDFFGTTATIMVAMSVLTLGLLAVSSGILVIVFMVFALAVAALLGFFEMSLSAFVVLVAMGLIIIIKLARARR